MDLGDRMRKGVWREMLRLHLVFALQTVVDPKAPAKYRPQCNHMSDYMKILLKAQKPQRKIRWQLKYKTPHNAVTD